MQLKFSETKLKNLETTKKKYFGDQAQKHFFVRVMPTKFDTKGSKKPGKKSYVVRLRPDGHKGPVVETTIGEVGKILLERARKKARLILRELEVGDGFDLLFAMDEYLVWLGNLEKHGFDWKSVRKTSDLTSPWASLSNGLVPVSRAPSDLSAKFYVFRQFHKFMNYKMRGKEPTLQHVKPDHVREFLTLPAERFRKVTSKRKKASRVQVYVSPETKRRRLSAISALFRYFREGRELFPLDDLGDPTANLTVSSPNWSPKAINKEHIPALKQVLARKPKSKTKRPNQTSDRTLWIYRCFLACRLAMGTRAIELIMADWNETPGSHTNFFSSDLKTLVCWRHKNFHRTRMPEYIPVPLSARKILEAMRREGYVSPFTENKAVFFDDRRRSCKEELQGRICARRANEVFKEVCAEVKESTNEDIRQSMTQRNLRHTFVTNNIRAGVPLEKVSRAVRHKSLNTIKYYHEINQNDAATLADDLPEI